MLLSPRLFTALLLLLAPTAARGETPAAVHPFAVGPGARVRLWTWASAGGLVAAKGYVSAADHEGMMVVVRNGARLVPFGDIERLDVRRGRSWARRGALVGLAAGVVAGSWLFADDLNDGHADGGDRLREGAWLGAVGAGVGALTGAAIHPARWQPVSLTLLPARRAAFSVSFRY